MSIKRIRRAMREDRYQLTIHALEEMDEDDLTEDRGASGHVARKLGGGID